MTREPSRLLDEFLPTLAEQWHARVESDLKGADFDRALGYRVNGFSADPLYYPGDVEAADSSGFPGTTPFTRGFRVPKVGADERSPWSPAQIVDYPDPKEANRRLLHALSLGAQRLWLRLGDGGVRIDGRGDLDQLLNEVEPRFIELMVDAEHGMTGAAFFLDWARRGGVRPADLRGGFGGDPLARLARSGRLRAGLDNAWSQATEIARWCGAEAPGLRGLRVDTTPYHDAGASPVLELACGLASGAELLRQAEKYGMEPLQAARQIEVVHAVGCDLFLEIAKIRAWRRLWAMVLTACGAEAAIEDQTTHLMPSGVSRSLVDPWVNLLRSTTQVFVGAVTGVQSIVAGRFDELSGSGEDSSRRMAINTHHVLAEESYLARVSDPAGGSWALEAMSERLAEEAWASFRELERKGGIEALIRSGELKRMLAATVETREKDLARRKDVIVGVSMYANLSEQRPEPVQSDSLDPTGDPAGEVAKRAEDAVDLGELSSLDAVNQAIEAGASWHQVCRATATSDDSRCEPLEPFREAGAFESLRLAVDAAAKRNGERPSICLAQLGKARDARARSQFAADFFAAGGFTAQFAEPTDNPAQAAERFLASGAETAVLCSTDEVYAELAVSMAEALKAAGARRIFLAGRPDDHEDIWRKAGVDAYIYIGCDVYGVLRALVEDLYPDWLNEPPPEDKPSRGEEAS